MSVLESFKVSVKNSRLFNFNLVNRNGWIAKQAGLLAVGSRVLDAGAGSCPYRDYFSHCDYLSQDFVNLQPDQLAGGRYGQIDYVCDILSIPVQDGCFDAILCSEVIEHVPDPEAVMAEFARILKPGGKLLLTAPLGSGIHQEPYHFYGGYTPFWYQKVLSEKGFEQINVDANGGSLKAFAQESIRFVQLITPFGSMLSFLPSLILLPFWIVLFPVLVFIVPLTAHLLDRYDDEKRFTVGYFVTAIKR